ncbi:MAG: tRNA threonylcarbamoyladenosine dehydratase [Schwartzia succinivorans]|jgi:tRNA A37 threonylcarbamoyladenosine dehydratase|uniref:tRNA threonylcarbamoyladenosine dehydratase n=1 Tax=Schwartzia succinivorans TaxID=55507 RepID=UPI002357ACD5|nr:tRNA threonylcarbamoyladenosine dehydratase [Schwartzia succinivorans]MBE6097251.1 tRNA threonylcarbamoyladenosine dehydratase [Schwartzia succinivorans]
MLGRFSRTELLLGEAAMKKLADSRVAVFGVGGVGSFVAEGLVRAGVGHFLLVDNDLVCLTNLNRQIHATMKTVGKSKTEVMKERMLSINPEAEIETVDEFFLPETADKFFDKPLDYIVDAVDTVTAKIGLVMEGEKRGIPVMSSMGAGNKLDPSAFRVADIYETRVCPLAKVMRKELRARGIKKLKVVYSEEQPIKPSVSGCGANCICPPGSARNCDMRRAVPGSVSFVPSVAGLIIAGEVVKDLTNGIRREV